MKTVIYMAGTISQHKYRREIKKQYGNIYDIIDPFDYNKINNININDLCMHDKIQIVNIDKSNIDKCDIIIANVSDGPTFGTVMEIMYAYENDKLIYVIDTTNKYHNDIWLSAHADYIFESIFDCWNLKCK